MVGHTTDVLSPFISVLCHSNRFFHVLMLSIQAVRGLPRLRAPGIVPCIIFLQATPLFPHVVTIVLKHSCISPRNSSNKQNKQNLTKLN